MPSQLAQCAGGSRIAALIYRDLRAPKLGIGRRKLGSRTIVTVPKTTVHEYDRSIFGQDDVRFVRKPPGFLAEAKSRLSKAISNQTLRARPGAAHSRHDFGSLLGRENVHVAG